MTQESEVLSLMQRYFDVNRQINPPAGTICDAMLNTIIQLCTTGPNVTPQFRASVVAYLAFAVIEILKKDS